GRVEGLRSQPPDAHWRALPRLYLTLEHYLGQVDEARLARDDLRREVVEKFPELLRDPRFGLIFNLEDQQEILLGREFLKPLVDEVLELLGEEAHPSFFAISRWLEGLDERSLPAEDEEKSLGTPDRDGWAALLGRLGHDLYERLRDTLGNSVATQLFEDRYQQMAESYLGLDTFPAGVRLFPPELLDEKKLSLLSRSQTRRVLLDKLEELQAANVKLQENNADLEMALEIVERSNEELETRVEERTTELRSAKEEIQESEERLRRISEAAHDTIFMVDHRGRTTYMNDAAERLLGYTRDDLLGKALLIKVVPKRYRRRLSRSFRDGMEKGLGLGVGTTGEFVIQHRDGTELPVEISSSAVKFQGRWHLVGVARDIRLRKSQEEERRRLEEQLQEAQRLESLGILSGGIAHDFNNLLTAVLGHVGLMEAMADEDFPFFDSVQEIRGAVQRMGDLTQQMLAYSGRGHFVVEQISLADQIRDMSELLHSSVSKRAHLDFRFEPDLPRIMADAGQIQQVVMNLITNASDALGDQDGTVTVSAYSADVDRRWIDRCRPSNELLPGRYVVLEVQDTGAGMAAETRARMFEPFFSTRFTGRGLGLAAVLGIVRGHKGAIDVESASGCGTTVRILMSPAESPGASDAAEAAARNGKNPGGSILVVDDEPAVRFLARMVLEEYGFKVITAEDGLDAVETFRRLGDSIDLVLLDLTMPNMDGEQALAAIQQERPDVRVLLSSGYSRDETMTRFAGRGVTGFVPKPYEVEALVDEVRRALGSESASGRSQEEGPDPARVS
ncbi:MAG: PAS domain S-box protein, partial [Acidobacteriota bacterium]